MKKDNNPYYFSHDSNARNDDKIIAVRMRLGTEGYGIYFMILERLMDCTDYMSAKDYNIIAFDLHVSADKVKAVVEDFNLFSFTEDGNFFYSESLLRRMVPLHDIKEKRRKAGIISAEKRAERNKESTHVEQVLNTCSNKSDILLPENPTKEIKEKENIKKESTPKGVLKKDELSLPSSSVKNEPIDFKSLQETFNTMFADKLPMVQLLSPKRRAAVRARASEYGKSAIMDVFRKVQESSFLLGHNDRNWHCDFDWIFKPTNFIKILEGTYDNKSDNEIQAGRAYTGRVAPNNKEASRAALEKLADAILEQHQP
jgi:hypothetical protein